MLGESGWAAWVRVWEGGVKSVCVNQFIFSLSSPLPNIIILGDFNLPGVDWFSSNMSSRTTPLVDLREYLFLNQQVHKPTRKSYSRFDLLS